MYRKTIPVVLFGLLGLAFAGIASATAISYPNFNSTAGLTMVGNTATTGSPGVLRIVPANEGQSGAAYSTTPITLGTSATFSTQFQFRFTAAGGIDPADGITFVLAASPNGLGGAGGGLGYIGVPNSVAIEFDTYNNGPGDGNSSNHVGIDTGGALNMLAFSNVYGIQYCDFFSGYTGNGCMSNGHVWTALITYDGTTQLLNVTLTDPAMGGSFSAISDYMIDIGSLLGTNTAYVGFTGSTGSGWENEDILNWTFANTATLPPVGVPEPNGLLLLSLGLLGLVGLRSRARLRWR